MDNEAVNVKWEVITDEDDGNKPKHLMGESLNSSIASPAVSGPLFSNSQSLDIGIVKIIKSYLMLLVQFMTPFK